jgi:putative endonuclease
MTAACVYMLLCSDGKYYVGSHRSEDVRGRVREHNEAVHPKAWTARRRPVELVWVGGFELITDAIGFERQLKGWVRAEKEALIRGDWDEISRLSKGPNYRPPMTFEERFDSLAAREAEREAVAPVAGPPRPSTSSG